jgi:hypothetical protein
MTRPSIVIKRYLTVSATIAIICLVAAAIGVLRNRVALAQDIAVFALIFVGATAAYWNCLKLINKEKGETN